MLVGLARLEGLGGNAPVKVHSHDVAEPTLVLTKSIQDPGQIVVSVAVNEGFKVGPLLLFILIAAPHRCTQFPVTPSQLRAIEQPP